MNKQRKIKRVNRKFVKTFKWWAKITEPITKGRKKKESKNKKTVYIRLYQSSRLASRVNPPLMVSPKAKKKKNKAKEMRWQENKKKYRIKKKKENRPPSYLEPPESHLPRWYASCCVRRPVVCLCAQRLKCICKTQTPMNAICVRVSAFLLSQSRPEHPSVIVKQAIALPILPLPSFTHRHRCLSDLAALVLLCCNCKNQSASS